jgi:hypothetical protein
VRREGTPELVSAVERGGLSVSAAATIAKKPQAEQKRIVELPPDRRQKEARQTRKAPAVELIVAYRALSSREQDEFLAAIGCVRLPEGNVA